MKPLTFACWGIPVKAMTIGQVTRVQLPDGFRAERCVFGTTCPATLLGAYDGAGERVEFQQIAPTQYVFQPHPKPVRTLLLVATHDGDVAGGIFGLSRGPISEAN